MKLRSIFRSIPIFKRIYPSLFFKFSYFFDKRIFLIKFRNIYLNLDIRDPIDRSVLLFDFYEDEQIKYLCTIFKKNKINYFFDIGANCGIYSLVISKLFPKTSTLSFEPIKSTFKKLEKNHSLNPTLKNIKKYNYGLSNKNSKLKMKALLKNNFIQSGGFGVANNKDNLKNLHTEFAVFKKADDKFKYKNQVICLKIDVEGHEIFVLEGIKKIINNNKIFLQIEILPDNFIKTNKWLNDFNFKKIHKINADYYFLNK
ncbi:FkbM family methyltransferase [Candidatus Pelagibacter sp.]|nr:FkbM family methyltransferase [Candidatus Pelagibacter sp.]